MPGQYAKTIQIKTQLFSKLCGSIAIDSLFLVHFNCRMYKLIMNKASRNKNRSKSKSRNIGYFINIYQNLNKNY